MESRWYRASRGHLKKQPAVTAGTLFTMATPDYTCVPCMYQKDRATSNNGVSINQNQAGTPPEGLAATEQIEEEK